MRMTTQLDSLQIDVGVDLVRGTQLVVANDFSVRDLLPPGLAQQMLSLDGEVTQEAWVGHHRHVLIC